MPFIKLLHFELKRIWKGYAILILLVTTIQLFTIWRTASSMVSNSNEMARQQGLTLSEYAEEMYFQPASLFESLPVVGSIMLPIAVLLIYTLLIWYRDWFGKNTVMYRLLMLPANRASLYFAKLFAIFLLVLGMVALQIILLAIGSTIVSNTLPVELSSKSLTILSIVQQSRLYSVFLPSTFLLFLVVYGLGFTFLTVVYTAILLERSYRIKGLLLGLGYIACMFALNISLYVSGLSSYLFPSETGIITAAIAALTIVFSLWLSIYLIQKKVTV